MRVYYVDVNVILYYKDEILGHFPVNPAKIKS